MHGDICTPWPVSNQDRHCQFSDGGGSSALTVVAFGSGWTTLVFRGWAVFDCCGRGAVVCRGCVVGGGTTGRGTSVRLGDGRAVVAFGDGDRRAWSSHAGVGTGSRSPSSG